MAVECRPNFNDLYMQLANIYREYKPNGTVLLAMYPELVEQMNFLDHFKPQNESDILFAIEYLSSFIDEWFTDYIEKDEQQQIIYLLENAYSSVLNSRNFRK